MQRHLTWKLAALVTWFFYDTTMKSIKALLGSFNDVASLDAVGADGDLLYGAILESTNTLKVGIESALVDVVSVAHVVTYHGLFATYCTHLGHVDLSFYHVDGFVKRPVGRIFVRQDTSGLPALFYEPVNAGQVT